MEGVVMTDIKLLILLNDYYTAQRNVVISMYWAMEYFERGREDSSWVYLFEWCENKDRRAALWKRFKHHYPKAMMLKEGHEI
jgi:hypothetical protein